MSKPPQKADLQGSKVSAPMGEPAILRFPGSAGRVMCQLRAGDLMVRLAHVAARNNRAVVGRAGSGALALPK
eukprot:4230858-Alexandrium_andersonii.AAC.1